LQQVKNGRLAYWKKMQIEMAEDIRRAVEESEDDEDE
jgi:hypothetical protein